MSRFSSLSFRLRNMQRLRQLRHNVLQVQQDAAKLAALQNGKEVISDAERLTVEQVPVLWVAIPPGENPRGTTPGGGVETCHIAEH